MGFKRFGAGAEAHEEASNQEKIRIQRFLLLIVDSCCDLWAPGVVRSVCVCVLWGRRLTCACEGAVLLSPWKGTEEIRGVACVNSVRSELAVHAKAAQVPHTLVTSFPFSPSFSLCFSFFSDILMLLCLSVFRLNPFQGQHSGSSYAELCS